MESQSDIFKEIIEAEKMMQEKAPVLAEKILLAQISNGSVDVTNDFMHTQVVRSTFKLAEIVIQELRRKTNLCELHIKEAELALSKNEHQTS